MKMLTDDQMNSPQLHDVLFSAAALRWLEVILFERFGHALALQQNAATLLMSLQGSEKVIRFDRLLGVFHRSQSDFPCALWQASAEGFDAPVEDGIPAPSEAKLPSPLIEMDKAGATIHYDILGLTYWMLTRMEEIGRTDLDEHQRFPAISSHAFKHGYLERPIVDEWLHILGQVMQRIWPQVELKQHRFSMKVSHDVDVPSRYGFRSAKGLARAMVGDVVKRCDLKSALLAPWIRFNTRTQLHPADPANTFDWIMDQSEWHGLTSAFYFICGRTDVAKDADYEIEHPAIRDLLRRIHTRGHEIGLHPSYNSCQRPDQIVAEADRLKRVCDEEGIKQDMWGGRMHYLRWEHPTSLRGWEQAGMTYDSTLGYADLPGFRCGTCFEYPAFDPVEQNALRLRIRPLVAMECTIVAERYMGLGTTQVAYEKFKKLKDACRAVGGTFSMLWHNSGHMGSDYKAFYVQVIHHK